MERNFIGRNTIKLADLAHKYGAFYQQHSCGGRGTADTGIYCVRRGCAGAGSEGAGAGE